MLHRDGLRSRAGCWLLLILLAVATAACGSPARAVSPRVKARPLAIAFVGDSLTYGMFATSEDDAYTQLVASALHARAVVRGISGASAVSLGTETPLPQGVATVVVEVGTNDFDQPVGIFARGYGALIDRMQAANPGATFVCLGLWRGTTDRSPQTGLSPAALDAAIQRACPGIFISLTPIYMDATVHGPAGRPTWRGAADTFHPNDLGHRRLAEAIIGVLPTRMGVHSA